ncbi:MAG: hypothetical protein ACR2ID_05830 [Chthoniobacterales bacterium]
MRKREERTVFFPVEIAGGFAYHSRLYDISHASTFSLLFAAFCAAVTLGALGLSASLSAQGLPGYSIVDLGALTMPGGGRGQGVNDFGQVGGYSTASDGRNHAVLYGAGMNPQDIGTLGMNSIGYGINNLGQVAGQFGNFSGTAFLYTPGVGMQSLGVFDPGGNGFSRAYGVNNAGAVTGYSSNANGSFQHAFLYTAGTGMQDIGSLGGTQSAGFAINGSNQIVGRSLVTGNAGFQAFVYNPGTGMMNINTLGGQSEAHGINSFGIATGTVQGMDLAGYAFRWDPVNGMVTLATPGSWMDVIGNSINDAGEIVGSASISGGMHAIAFIDGTSYDLQTLITASSPFTTLLEAFSVNASGQITGYSTSRIDGLEHAFLLTPIPEPGSVALIALGTLILGIKVWQRKRIDGRARINFA